MISGELHVMPTEISPEFLFKPEGLVSIRGRGFRKNQKDAPENIIRWIDAYITDPAEVTLVIIALEYLNDTTSHTLISFLKKLKTVLLKNKKINVLWYHEPGDEDMIERGEYISHLTGLPVNFIVTENIKKIS